MEKKGKTSPVPGANMFDPTALLGASPFSPSMAAALPFAHLAHLPGAFSMLGHPAFPVSSLFGHLGDANPLGLPTSSLSSSLSPTSVASTSLSFDSLLSPLLLSMGQGGPISDPFSLIASPTSKGDHYKFGHFSVSSASATPTTTTTTSHSSSSSRRSLSPLGRSGGGRGGSGRGRRSGGRGRGRRGGSKPSPAIPLSLVQSTSILSPSMLEKFTRKHLESKSNGFSTETSPERKSMSSLFDINFDKDSYKNKPSSHSSSRRSASPSRPSDSYHGNGETSTGGQEDVHIDSMKKKLLGDQIRHRMQSKAPPGPVDLFGSLAMGLGSRKRRGRPPKISQDECNLTPKELEEEARIQENIRQHLEMELKQKEMALKMIVNKDKEGSRSNRGKGKGRRSSKSPLKPPEGGAAATNGKLSESDGHLDDSDAKDRSESEAESSKGKDGDIAGHYNFPMDMNDLGSGASCSEADNYTEDSDNDTGDDGTPGGKRKIEYNESGRPIKRRHVVLDDSKIRIPLEKGWKRQTNIHSYGRRGIVGEVWYFAPCGRKMKTIPDVMRYIERNNVTDLGRGHFSFNTKVNVGDFYEARVNAGDNGFVKLSETEIQDRLSVTVSRRLKKIENQKKRENMKIQQAMARQMIESKMKQRMEQQEMARKVAEMQLQKKFQREQQKELMKRAKQMKIIEKKKQREMERQQREEQLRLKQELRAKQLLEEQEMKRQQVALLKEQMRIRQEQERRRQHMILLKALEQRKKQEEREKQREEKIAEKRLHRERKEEQRKMEFVLAQELKKPREDMELRDHRTLPDYPRIKGNYLDGEAFADCLMSLEFLHNFAKPLGFDSETLPTLKSLQDAVSCKTEEDGEEYMSIVTHLMRYALDDPGVPNPKEAVTKLGQKITDLELTDAILSEVLRVFMVVRNGGETQLSEYLRNYSLEACTIKQRAGVIAFLCNELNCSKMITTEIEGHLETMGDIRRDKWVVEGKLRRLRSLRFKKFKTSTPKPAIGENESCDDSVMTSISKQSDDEEDKEDSGHEDENYNEGETEEDDPTSLEECEKAIDKLQKQHAQYRDKVFKESQYVRAIDLGQDRYKRNYWILPHAGGVFVEGLESGEIKDMVLPKTRCERSDSKTLKVEVIDEKTEKKAVEFLEDIPEKKISDLVKKENSGKNADESKDKLADLDKMFTDGKQVNGLIKSENEVEVKKEKKELVKSESDNVKTENEVRVNSESCKDVSKEIEKSEKVDKSLCNGDIGDKAKDSGIINGDVHSGNEVKSPTKHVELKIPNIKSSAIEEGKSDTDSNLYLHVPQTTKLSDFCSMSIDAAMKSEPTQSNHPTSSSVSASATITSSLFFNTSFPDHVTKSSTHHQPPLPSPCPPLAHSKTTQSCERKASFMSIDSILDKTTSSHSSQSTNSLPVNPFVSQTSTRVSDSTGSSDSQPWFSLLPRVPCDDMSLTRGQHSSGMLMSPPFMSQIPFHPFSIQTPAFPSFQMGNLFSTSLTSTNSSSSPSSSSVYTISTTTTTDTSSFKKPEPVNTSQHNPEDMLKSLQGEAKPIPEVYKMGWWKINEGEKVQEIQRNLHPRGIRERSLHKTIQRFQEYTEASCKHSTDSVLCMESSSEEEVTDHEEDTDDKTENDSAENSNKDNTEDIGKDNADQNDIADNKDNAEDSVNKSNADTTNENSSASNDLEATDPDTAKDMEDGSTDDDKQENSNNGCDNTPSDTKDNTNDNTDPDSESKESANSTDEDKNSDGNKTGKRSRGKKLSKVMKKKKKMKKVKKPPPTIDCKARSDECDRLILEEVEVLEDKIATASLQIKGWKLAPKTFSEESEIRIISRGETKRDENDCYPLEAAKERLLQLELNIERRYLKPPLSKAHRISLNSMSNPQQQQQQQQEIGDDNDSDVDFENLPIGLQLWRIGVATASSPAQLMLCVIQLNKSISWEKSIMKVLCQICRKDDNEAELLLCDGCDRGYHTYCFKPKIEEIPAGDWYCFECVAKAGGETCCLVCGKRFGRMAECNQCNRFCHIDCLDPPLPRVPRKWHCASCDDNVKSGSAKKRVRKNSTASTTASTTASNTASTQSTPSSTPLPDLTPSGRKRRSDFGVPRKRKASDGTAENETPQKKECIDKDDKPEENEKVENVDDTDKFKQQELSTDLKICRTMLTEMMKHEDGWPFLQPVNCKHFPSYRKYIKQPMDFGTMKIKLRDHVYQARSEFTKDAITVFDNCQLFNEDDSEVGQCGHNMREFFTRRWKELIFEAMTEVDS